MNVAKGSLGNRQLAEKNGAVKEKDLNGNGKYK